MTFLPVPITASCLARRPAKSSAFSIVPAARKHLALRYRRPVIQPPK
jgi:hypothetical protein